MTPSHHPFGFFHGKSHLEMDDDWGYPLFVNMAPCDVSPHHYELLPAISAVCSCNFHCLELMISTAPELEIMNDSSLRQGIT